MGRSNRDNARVEIPLKQKADGTYEAHGNKRVEVPLRQKADKTYEAKVTPKMTVDAPKRKHTFKDGGPPVHMNIKGPHKLKSGKLYE